MIIFLHQKFAHLSIESSPMVVEAVDKLTLV